MEGIMTRNTDDAIEYFIAGLKQYIKASDMTQEEFAKGVTSKVNISNILRRTSGTSASMRQALAAKAGMTVEEIVQMGKQLSLPKNGHIAAALPIIEPPQITEPEEASGGSISDIMNRASEYTLGLHAELTGFAKKMAGIIKDLVRERDKLVSLLAQEQAVTNVMPQAIKVLDKDMNVVYVNKTMMERFQCTPGDLCEHDGCNLCMKAGLECAARTVFAHGKPVKRIMKINGDWFALSAQPIVDTAWNIIKVVVVISFMTEWLPILHEQGFVLTNVKGD